LLKRFLPVITTPDSVIRIHA